MYRDKIILISKFIAEAERLNDPSKLEDVIVKYSHELGDLEDTPELSYLAQNLFRLSRRFIDLRSDKETVRKISELTFEERIELEQVEHIIDGNLLCYHFQPIVSAEDGSVFSYEALMRPIGSPLISPYHILKYAALTERLQDIERLTFVNVLTILDKEPEKFFGHPVFINSMPNVVLPPEDNELIGELLARSPDKAVIEMTESGEMDDRKFNMLKEKYRTLNIRIAIDDYGTGYSNVKNLLNYMPDFVKIDRSLLAEIHNSQKKRHFVRDIIEFCHDNGILALAEGVETSEELRAVILLGVDLIQGFYTARPAPEPIQALNEEVVAEIRRCRAELLDGIASKQYVASDGENINVDRLGRDGYSRVLIGKDMTPGSTVELTGTPTNETSLCIIAAKGFEGTIIIHQLKLAGLKGTPCILLSEGCNVKIKIAGENLFKGGGICVPEKAVVDFIGKGSLTIELDDSYYYGIGNDMSMPHGELNFNHDSMITIVANGQYGVCIGAGKGGRININRGKYLLVQQGGYGVSVGSLGETSVININECDLETKLSSAKGTSIGSLYGNSEISISRSSFRCFAGGLTVSALGSVDGKETSVTIDNANVSVDVRADDLTVVGALKGNSEINVSKASFRINAAGNNALAFGSAEGETKLNIINADVGVELSTELDVCTYAPHENISISGGRCIFNVNGKTEEL